MESNITRRKRQGEGAVGGFDFIYPDCAAITRKRKERVVENGFRVVVNRSVFVNIYGMV